MRIALLFITFIITAILSTLSYAHLSIMDIMYNQNNDQVSIFKKRLATQTCTNYTFLYNSTCIVSCPNQNYVANIQQSTCDSYSASSKIVNITTSLSLTSISNILSLKLSSRNTKLIEYLKNYTTITINNQSYKRFNYTIIDNNNNIVSIKFAFYDFLNYGTPLTLQINIPAFIDNNIVYIISPLIHNITLMEYNPSYYDNISNICSYIDMILLALFALVIILQIIQYKKLYMFQTYFWIQQIQFLRYINISYPAMLNVLWSSFDGAVYGYKDYLNAFIKDLLSPIQTSNDYSTILPGRFSVFGISLYFIDIFASRIVIFLILLIISGIIHLIYSCIKTKISKFFQNIHGLFYLNLPISCLLAYFLPISIHSAIQFANFQYTTYSIICISVAGLIFCLQILLIIMSLVIANNYYDTITNKPKEFKEFLKKIASVNILVIQFKAVSENQPCYLALLLFRGLIIAALLVFGYTYPLLQTSLIFIINLCIFILLIKIKPFKEKVLFIENIVCEGIVILINSLILAFSIFELSYINFRNSTLRDILGFTVLGLYWLLIIWLIIMTMTQLILELLIICIENDQPESDRKSNRIKDINKTIENTYENPKQKSNRIVPFNSNKANIDQTPWNNSVASDEALTMLPIRGNGTTQDKYVQMSTNPSPSYSAGEYSFNDPNSVNISVNDSHMKINKNFKNRKQSKSTM